MYGKHQWKGREVEGRYSDLMTFFVRDLNHNIKKTYGLEVENFNEYPHYYFTIEFMKKSMKDEKYLESIRRILDESNCAVTIEATTGDGDNIHGHSIDGEDGAAQTVTEGTGVDVITFISGATKGDRVSLICDGVSYYVFGLAADKAHITFS